MSIIFSYEKIENKHDVYRGKDYMKTYLQESTQRRKLLLKRKK